MEFIEVHIGSMVYYIMGCYRGVNVTSFFYAYGFFLLFHRHFTYMCFLRAYGLFLAFFMLGGKLYSKIIKMAQNG